MVELPSFRQPGFDHSDDTSGLTAWQGFYSGSCYGGSTLMITSIMLNELAVVPE